MKVNSAVCIVSCVTMSGALFLGSNVEMNGRPVKYVVGSGVWPVMNAPVMAQYHGTSGEITSPGTHFSTLS